jgi:hypothetical protein
MLPVVTSRSLYSVFQSAEVQKLWVLGKRQEASAVSSAERQKSKGKKNMCTSLAYSGVQSY